LKNTNAAKIVQTLIAHRPFTQDGKSTGNAAHRGAGGGNKRPVHKIGTIEGSDFRTTGVNDTPETITG
jgi:hypothetical protein